ncbi:KLHL24 [Branchiostoma lanceolatum]|uniref:KLHL24 protein n=1 Tax=Branchiostoma lanceolatum TaxID=7740 RepID=A0A8K0AA56_BRALA|nr:KLHL24 [Branchiostoma lanceolatum]
MADHVQVCIEFGEEPPDAELQDVHQHVYEFEQPSHSGDLLVTMDELRRRGELTDVTLCAGDQALSCHRVVLASCSPYFRAMFAGDLMESRAREIHLKDINPDMVKLVADYAYTSRVTITRENVQDVLDVSDRFQIPAIKDACCEFLEMQLHPYNCIGIFQFADTHYCEDLRKKALDFALSKFDDVVENDEFVELTKDGLVEYLSHDDLEATEEEKVFEAGMKWLRYKIEERSQYICDVLNSVRLPLIDTKYLVEEVEGQDIVQNSSQCVELLYEAKNLQRSLQEQGVVNDPRVTPRRCVAQKVLLVLGGKSQTGPCTTMSYYDNRKQAWLQPEPLPMEPRDLSSVTTIGNYIYLTGGAPVRLSEASQREKLKDVWRYDAAVGKWSKLAPLHQGRCGHGSVAVSGHVYVLGGFDDISILSQVERYNPASNTWDIVAPMLKAVTSPAVVAFQKKIYVFGGFLEDETVGFAQCYDTDTGQWSLMQTPSTCETGASAVVLDGLIYIIGGELSRSVTVFDPSSRKFYQTGEMVEQRLLCGAAVLDDRIYVTGGVSHRLSAEAHDTIECYEPKTDTWRIVGTLPEPLYQHGCLTIYMSNHNNSKQQQQQTSGEQNTEE